ncbi:hypothetical protein CsSME_00031359 [Camellia sinensis var. sinensis]
MAEEVQYADSATNKRKYDDQTPPPSSRRTTGFSAPISSHSPDSANALPSYNTVPPPVDDIQLAKQRAQEIAVRLFNNAETTSIELALLQFNRSVCPPFLGEILGRHGNRSVGHRTLLQEVGIICGIMEKTSWAE